MVSTSPRISLSVSSWNDHWTRDKTSASAVDDSTKYCLVKRDWFAATGTIDCHRRRLFMWRAYKERNTMFAPSSRSSEVLATQRTSGDAAVGEVED